MNIKDRVVETLTPPLQTNASTSTNTRRTAILVIGDILVFLIFAAIGRRSHSEAGNFFGVAITALPFAVAWFLVSPFVGAFKRNVVRTPGKMSLTTLLAWLAAWPLALLLRGLFVDKGVPPLSFAIVTLITNTVLLQAWRTPAALFFRRKG